MSDRSSRADVRNPMLALPSVQAMATLPTPLLDHLRAALREVEADARARADKCWNTHKAPMAAYWKAKAVDARHLRLAIRRGA
jgi:hypothetical protein